ncbi:MAG TPA: hypothetical protein VKB19_00900 [Pedobacter sp.]|nr:hypothetical protein [Pedobacter sp.]
MKETGILVVCTQQEILNTIVRLINANAEMKGTGAHSLEEAITVFKSAAYDMVLIGAGLSAEEEKELEDVIAKSRVKVPVVHHYGGGSGLLFTEIYECLGKK